MTVEIRSATLQDYEALCNLMRQIDAQHSGARPDQFREAEPVRERAFFQSWFDDPDKHIWVAERSAGIAGVVMFLVRHTPDIPFIVPRRFIQVDTLVVDENEQRKGIGEALMGAVYQWGSAQHISDIELAVWAFNEGAIAFYRRLGYEVLYHKMGRKLE